MLDKVTDPVCGMAINPFEALGQSSHEGHVYYFCSEECKQKFDKRPEWYVEKQPELRSER